MSLFLSCLRLSHQKKEEKRRRKAVATLPHPRIPSGRSHAVVPNHLHPKNVFAVLGRTAARITVAIGKVTYGILAEDCLSFCAF